MIPYPIGAVSRAILLDSPQPHFMLVPSLTCPAECAYCFGPHRGPVMPADTMETTLDFMARIAAETGQRKVKVTFHGGEPLVAGNALWRQALDGLEARFGRGGYKVAVQSNLWLLDDELCGLFRQHKVQIGTSLDGPEVLTDAQRGPGYFARTMAGIRRAQGHGMTVGCIATFTPRNLPHWREIFDFFLCERLGFSIHAAVPSLPSSQRHQNPERVSPNGHCLSPAQYAGLLRQMLDYYIEHRREVTVSSLDQICQGLGCGDGKVCTFRDCLGMFLAIDPSGDIFPCQRFCGKPSFRLGALCDTPTLADLLASPLARRMAARQADIRQTCDGCAHLAYCKGGCAYNAWAAEGLDETKQEAGSRCSPRSPAAIPDSVDPYCSAYHAAFDHIQQRLAAEMASEENINAVADLPYDGKGHPLFRRGPLIELVREGPHPSEIARTAKRIIAAVELAKGPDMPAVASRLVTMDVCRTQQTAEASLQNLWQHLHPEHIRLNNLYIHLTFACQLRCTHCYAYAGTDTSTRSEMPVATLKKLVDEARETGFRQVIITGGEPLVHPQRAEMLAILSQQRRRSAANGSGKMNLVLRTNFAMPLSDDCLRDIAAAFDQVVVSVDGSEQTHDARRGRGSYAATIENIENYCAAVANHKSHIADPAELSLACVMRAADIQGAAGDSVRRLAHRLGIRRTRFRPLLPLGRARDWDEPPTSEAIGAHADPRELIENGFHPVASCGFGQNLYVEPNGESFPCYAYHEPHTVLGNVLTIGLAEVLGTGRNSQAHSCGFPSLGRHTVDTNPKCRVCEVRYLCGGACRAWGGVAPRHNLDAPPPECEGLHARAVKLLAAATEYLHDQPPPKEDDLPC